MRLVLLGLVLLACSAGPFESAGPDGLLRFAWGDTVIYVRQIAPPQAYADLYAGVERCSHRQGDWSGVTWFVASGRIQGQHGESYALWHNRHIILGPEWVNDSGIVRHEAMHDVLYVSGWRPQEPEPAAGYTHSDLHPSAYHVCADTTW